MADLQKPIPSYLNEKQNIIRLVIFTSVFALVFINIYAPFGADKWFSVTRLKFFTYSSLTILTGVLVVVISRMIMFRVVKRYPVLLWQYLVWIIAEVVSMALFYALFEKVFLNDPREFFELTKISSRHTALVLLLPYSVSWLYFSWKDKKNLLDDLVNEKPRLDRVKNMIPFYDEKGGMRLSVKMENLLYIESSDNYVTICYLNKDKVSRFLLRNTLKRMEEMFGNSSVIRCHRSFMVNFDKIKVIRKDKEGLILELDVPVSLYLPVSKTYMETVMNTFSKFS